MKHISIINIIEDFAPLSLQASWDNSGVQVGSVNNECQGVLVTLDITMDSICQAIDNNLNLIISHHPLIFNPLKTITPQTPNGEIIIKSIQHNITIYSTHTPLDVVDGGINTTLALSLHLNDIKPFNEDRIGVIGFLPIPLNIIQLCDKLKEITQVPYIKYSAPTPLKNKLIHHLALCGGSGGSMLNDVLKHKTDCFITGDIKHSLYIDSPIPLLDIGHFESEKQFINIIVSILSKKITTFVVHTNMNNTVNYR